MANLTVQQTKQLDTYLKTHKNVSREQAIKILFFRTPKTASAKGLEVEKSGGGQRAAAKKIRYNLGANSAKQGGILADKLYNQIEGASLNANTIKLLKQINPENVLFVLDAYNKKTKGKESLAQAIDGEWGLDATTVKEYICPALVKLAKNKNISGIYFGDYMKKQDIKSLNNWINNASTQIKTSLGVNLAETTVIKKTPNKQASFSISLADEKKLPEIYNNSKIKQTGQHLGQDIYNQIQGLSNPLETKMLLQKINAKNVIYVMKTYEKQSQGKETLIEGIADEYGLNYKDCKTLGKELYYYAKTNGVKVDDLVNEFNKADDIKTATTVTKKIYARINASKINKQTSLAPYTSMFGYGNELFKDFQKQTGVPLETAILQDPSIDKNKKIDLIRNDFTRWAKRAKLDGTNIDDIIKDADNDLQQFSNNKNFYKYSALYETTIDKLKSRIYSKYMATPKTQINGKIDQNFQQGRTGDCWLLAAIKGISRNPKGQKILNDSIKVNQNGTVTVHLKGVDKTYTISQKEINSATELSSGDGDVRALEIAVNRYLREDYKENNGQDASINGNYMFTAYKILTGKGGHFFPIFTLGDSLLNPEFYGDEPISDELIKEFNNKDQITCVAAHGNQKDIQVNTSKNTKGLLTKDHAYTVSHADQKYVYLINPWDTATELKVDKKTFKNFFTEIDKFEL